MMRNHEVHTTYLQNLEKIPIDSLDAFNYDLHYSKNQVKINKSPNEAAADADQTDENI